MLAITVQGRQRLEGHRSASPAYLVNQDQREMLPQIKQKTKSNKNSIQYLKSGT